MLTLLFAMLDGVLPDDMEPSTIYYLIGGELVIFDVPAIVFLIVIWRSVLS